MDFEGHGVDFVSRSGGSTGSRRAETLLDRVRARLARLGGAADEVTAIPVLGPPVAALESAMGRLVPPGGGVLVLDNGGSAESIAEVARILRLPYHLERFGWAEPVDVGLVEARLRLLGGSITHVAVTHYCAPTGLLNPVDRICELARRQGVEVIVEASGTYGALPVQVGPSGADVVVLGADGCLQAAGGLAWLVARRRVFSAARAFQPRSLYLDPVAEFHHAERTGETRFPIPPGVLGAVEQALDRLEGEGGVGGRLARYARTRVALRHGLAGLGFEPLLPAEHEGGPTLAVRGPGTAWFDPMALRAEAFARPFAPEPIPGLDGALCFSVGGAVDADEVAAFLTDLGQWVVRRKTERSK